MTMIAILLTTIFIVVDFSESASECYHAVDGYDYRGTVSMTVNGYTCQKWTEQSPHSHTRTPENYPNGGLGEHNYCRNQAGWSGVWCYTTDSSVRWELCDIGQPDENCVPDSECYNGSDGNEENCANECYHAVDAYDYRGTVSRTENGRTCQKWTEQSPHSHTRTPENYPNGGLGEHNYCRNPAGWSGVWCYTTDPYNRWELCDIGQPDEHCANECYHESDGNDYRGTVSMTVNWNTCQEWTEQSPHSHSKTPENYPNAGLGEHNYCRNPDGGDGAWCYTTDSSVRLELCDIGQPEENCEPANECYHESDGSDYRGTVSRTIDGRTCQKWTEQSPHSHTRTPENYPDGGLGEHNYCRNPAGWSGVWCYTTDPYNRWELCDIGQPDENCACEFPDNMRNVAQGKSSTQSSLKSGKLGPDVGPEKAVDGDYNPDAKSGLSCSWTNKEMQPWWKVDLGQIFSIYEVVITNREDCCSFRIKNAEVRVGNSENFEDNPVCGMMIIGRMTKENPIHVRCGCETPMEGRFVSIQLIDRENMLTLCEVEVMAT
ncbi:apolipoprotein(a)-like isoform X2 [Ptychodera flava]|uniref:apolipoprotein(a)-like isoform X2 n=1 Tax=Ptychodera flava TaxID=63121 RepID=UPI00396A2ABC